MDATTLGNVTFASPAQVGRPRTDYRAARRNAAKAARMLPEWRESVADAANERANLSGRAAMANGAREAAAKAVVNQIGRRHAVAASAMLSFYRANGAGRAVSRICRELERQVRA